MRFLKIILSVIVVFLLAALLIGIYLGPDDLRFCNTPGASGKCGKVDAIVVISGGDTVARTAEAVKLYKAGYADVLVLSGAAADKSGPSNAATMRRQAIDAGVPGDATLIEEHSETTDQNASNTVELLKDRGYTSFIVVTSAYHQRRADFAFKHYAPTMIVRSHPVAEDKDWNRFWFMTPWGWNLAISEMIKSAVAATGGVDRS